MPSRPIPSRSPSRPAMRSAGVPSKTIRPPSWPAPGPRSMIQSACAMTAWWCSMTMTDLPESTSRSSRPSSCSTWRRGGRRANAEVAEPDVGEAVEDAVRGRRVRLAGAEELLGLGHRHREHLADVAAAEVVVEHRRLVPLPLAVLAGGGDAGHHCQVGIDDAGAVAVGASALGVG